MDFIFSLSLAKYEVYFLLANASLLIVYLGTWLLEKGIILFRIAFGNSQVSESGTIAAAPETPVSPAPKKTSAKASQKSQEKSAENTNSEESVNKNASEADVQPSPSETSNRTSVEDRQNIIEITKIVKTKIARGEFSEAKSKIVEWLTIDKFDKELNSMLASLYERDQDYRRAELVYKDLVIVHDTDPELYTKLGFALSMQGKYEIAYEIYKKLLSLDNGSHDEAHEMLANLAGELSRYEEARDHAKAYLKNHPRSSDMLSLLASAHSALGEKPEALAALEKLKVIEPYNAKIRDLAEKIRLEIELAGSFQSPTPPESNP